MCTLCHDHTYRHAVESNCGISKAHLCELDHHGGQVSARTWLPSYEKMHQVSSPFVQVVLVQEVLMRVWGLRN